MKILNQTPFSLSLSLSLSLSHSHFHLISLSILLFIILFQHGIKVTFCSLFQIQAARHQTLLVSVFDCLCLTTSSHYFSLYKELSTLFFMQIFVLRSTFLFDALKLYNLAYHSFFLCFICVKFTNLLTYFILCQHSSIHQCSRPPTIASIIWLLVKLLLGLCSHHQSFMSLLFTTITNILHHLLNIMRSTFYISIQSLMIIFNAFTSLHSKLKISSDFHLEFEGVMLKISQVNSCQAPNPILIDVKAIYTHARVRAHTHTHIY